MNICLKYWILYIWFAIALTKNESVKITVNKTTSLSLSLILPTRQSFAADFGANWAIVNYYRFVFWQDIQLTQIYQSNSISVSNQLVNWNKRLIGDNQEQITNKYWIGYAGDNYIRVYSPDLYNVIYTSPSRVDDVVFASQTNYLIYIASSNKQIHRFNFMTRVVSHRIEPTTKKPFQIKAFDNFLIVYSQDNTNSTKAYISMYYSNNLTLFYETQCIYKSILTTDYYSFIIPVHHTMYYDPVTQFLVRGSEFRLQIWNISNNLLILNTTLANRILQVCMLSNYLVIQASYKLYIYETLNWTVIGQGNYDFDGSTAYMKCFQTQNWIGTYSPNQHITYYNLIINTTTNSTISNNTNNTNTASSTNITNITNSTNNTSTTNSTNSSINTTNITNSTNGINNTSNSSNNNNNITNNVSDTTNNSGTNNLSLNGSEDSQIDYLLHLPSGYFTDQKFIEILKTKYHMSDSLIACLQVVSSKSCQKTANVSAQMISISTATGIATPIVRPLANLFEQFWFYGYHTKIYPLIVELFAKQGDLLTQLRLKPHFLQIFNFQVDYLAQINNKFLDVSMFQKPRIPDQIFFISSLKQFFFYSFIFCCINFFLIQLLFLLTKYLKKKSDIWQKFKNYFQIRKIWWNFLVMSISFNIRSISFYCFVQLNIASNFSFSNKINLIITILTLAIVLAYTLNFYPLVFRFQKAKISQQVLQISCFKMSSFIMQMSLNCIRCFFQAFIHASLINSQQLQVALLLIIDIIAIVFCIKFKNYFRHSATFYFTSTYLMAFVIFDFFIVLYSNNTLNQFNYESTFFGIVFLLGLIMIAKILFFAGLTIYQIYQICFKPKNKIQNQPFTQKQKKQQNLKKVEQIQTKQKRMEQFQNKNDKQKPIYQMLQNMKIQQKIITLINLQLQKNNIVQEVNENQKQQIRQYEKSIKNIRQFYNNYRGKTLKNLNKNKINKSKGKPNKLKMNVSSKDKKLTFDNASDGCL